MDKMIKELNKDNYANYLELLKKGKSFHEPLHNCLKYGYYSMCRPINWFKNIRQFFRTLRYAWQRVVHGYCDWDAWEMDSYLMTLIADMLDDLSVNSHGYPGMPPYDTYESWSNALQEQAHMLRIAEDEDGRYYSNPLETDYINNLIYNDEHGIIPNDTSNEAYWEIEKNICSKREECFNKAMDWFKAHHRSLWD